MRAWLAVACLLSIALSPGCDTSVTGRLSAPGIGDLSAGTAPQASFRAPLVDACGPGGITRLGADSLMRRPLLTQVTPTSVELLWMSRTDDWQGVDVSRPGGDAVIQVESQAESTRIVGWRRRASITGLTPGAIHCYAVRDADGVLLQRTGVRTPPTAGQVADEDRAIHIVAFGDVGWRTVDQDAVHAQIQRVPMELITIAGDVSYPNGSFDQLQRNFLAVYQDILVHVPAVPACGNHDKRTRDGAPLLEAFGLERCYYTRDWGPVHLVSVDSQAIDDTQLDWLDRDLARNRRPWVIVVLHKPPLSSGHHGGHRRTRTKLKPLFEKHRVPLVIAGHEHSYERTHAVKGVTYVITGGGGRGTRPVGTSSFTAHSAQVAHFVHITIRGDTLTLYAVDGTGKTFDSAVIRRP